MLCVSVCLYIYIDIMYLYIYVMTIYTNIHIRNNVNKTLWIVESRVHTLILRLSSLVKPVCVVAKRVVGHLFNTTSQKIVHISNWRFFPLFSWKSSKGPDSFCMVSFCNFRLSPNIALSWTATVAVSVVQTCIHMPTHPKNCTRISASHLRVICGLLRSECCVDCFHWRVYPCLPRSLCVYLYDAYPYEDNKCNTTPLVPCPH